MVTSMNGDKIPTSKHRAGGDSRGSSKDRAARRRNLLRHWGDGTTCACTYCGMTLRDNGGDGSGKAEPDHVEADKILTREEGGRYVMPNVVPACRACNLARGDRTFADWCATVGVDADAIRAHAAAYRRR